MALGMVCDRPVCDWRFPAVVGVDAACFQQVVQVFQWSPSRCQFWSLACARLCSRVSSTGHVIGKLERPLARPRREAHEAIQHARGWPRCHAQPRSRRSDEQNLDSRADEDKTNTRYEEDLGLNLRSFFAWCPSPHNIDTLLINAVPPAICTSGPFSCPARIKGTSRQSFPSLTMSCPYCGCFFHFLWL